jgi:hypothetical protein
MSGTRQFSLERLAARAEIQDVIYRWCRAVDRCDWHALPDIFHPDARDNHGIYIGDIDGLTAWLSERHKSITRSAHFVTNILIEFTDNDNAVVETYALALQRYPGDAGKSTRAAIAGGVDVGDQAFDMLISGRYIDHFQWREEWKILDRTVIFDNSVLLPVAAAAAQLGSDWAISKRDQSDPMWALREKHGLTTR